MNFFRPFTTRQLAKALNDSIRKYEDAEDKEDQCDPEVPLLIMIGKNRYNVLSFGGDPNEPGLVIEARPEKEF